LGDERRELRRCLRGSAETLEAHDLPSWHKRGVGLVWETYEKPAVNPKTGAAVSAQRRRLAVIEELPAREAYATGLEQLIGGIGSDG
jgi:tRNA(His) guanylyltransferase